MFLHFMQSGKYNLKLEYNVNNIYYKPKNKHIKIIKAEV